MLKTFLIDGDKGGIGKTMVSRIVADTFVRHKTNGLPSAKIICLDADHTNPDFAGSSGYEADASIFATGLINLDDPDNWMEMMNTVEPYIEMAQTEEVRIIISLPATIQRAFVSGSEAVGQAMEMLNAVPVWVVGDTDDSVKQLQKRYELMPRRFEHGIVVLNQKFGNQDKFVHWNGSEIQKEIIGSGDWIETTIPVLGAATARRLGRTPFHVAESNRVGMGGEKLGLGDLIAVKAFRNVATVDLSCVEKMGG
jgi:hypothetical protein